ncbi:hypothetical protein FQN53_003987 [Emmonsiellopsis sp. PD_33]|nr:hypothetical protein FQN53_003987 [Emmonsiellopsis sp. PD_33]
MRAKRSKKYRKLMHQYELTFGFRAPYQVLVDSNFLRAVHSFKMDLVPALERTLQGKVKPFITKCSLAAVMESTPPQPGSRPNARPPQLPPPTILPLRYCSHNEDSKPIDETACLLSLLSPNADAKKNKEHYILATADPAPPPEPAPSRNPQKWKNTPPPPEPPKNLLRRAARQIPGVPIIYVKRSVMILEPLSGSSEGVREGYERGKFKTGMLSNNNVTGKRKRDGGDDDDDDDDGGNEGGEGAGAIKEKKKVKKVKGPNPLSVKKAKAKPKPAATGGDGKKERSGEVKAHTADVAAKEERPKETTKEEGESAVKTKRKRRHKSNKSGGEAGAGASAPSQPESAGAFES